MKRTSLFSLAALVLAAGVAMSGAALAQDPPPAGDPDPMIQAATGDQPGSQPSNPTYDPNRPSADPYRPPDPNAPSAADPATDPDRNLPATASNAPVLLLIGAVALGTLAAFLVLRRRGVTNN